MTEDWLWVAGFEGLYEVSKFGGIRSVARTVTELSGRVRRWQLKLIKANVRRDGYLQVTLSKDGRIYTRRFHTLVAAAFCKNQYGSECVNHMDGDKENNRADNLEWTTFSWNNSHALALGLRKTVCGERHVQAKLSEKQVMEIRSRRSEPRWKVGRDYGVTGNTITDILHGRSWTHLPWPSG